MAATTSSHIASLLQKVTKAIPSGGETRQGQMEMAAAVDKSIRGRRHLIVEAGTGTGKSLGYLVPAIVSGAKVVVSTATKALQDQLANKDLPFLAENLGIPFTYSVLKGRSNYFCKQKALEFDDPSTKAAQIGLDGLSDDGWASTAKAKERIGEEVRQLIDWAEHTSVGDRAELSFEPSPAAWSALSVAAGECPGAAKCPSGEACFAEKAREMAATSDVVVVNTHLYGQHVRSGGHILPEHDVVIFDEAHEVEDIIADSLGLEISAGRFMFLTGRMRQIISDFDATVDLIDAGTQIEHALTPFAGERLPNGPSSIESVRNALNTAATRTNKALELLKGISDDATGGAGPRKIRAVQAATQLIDDLVTASELGTTSEAERPDERVAWVEAPSKNRGPVLRIAPIEVGGSLATAIWGDTTAIFTSATIPSNLGARLGLSSETTVSIKVDSPFDYKRQGLLYCAVDLPDPRNDRFESASHVELARLLRAAGGRTLALFTSWKAMTAAAEAMRALKPALPFHVYTQSDLPKPALTKAFAEDETSCLFATMGFWQGIDVPGRALSMVVIDKLPFSRPDEPLLVARREKVGDAAFRLIDLPRASMMLAQGCGRLIRKSTDRGVVAVLDSRLNSAKSYRNDLLAALPPMKRTRLFSEVAAFLTEITQ